MKSANVHEAVTDRAEPMVMAVDNGGTNTRIHLRDGENFHSVSYPTPQDYEAAIDLLNSTVKELTDKPVDAVGFAIAGNVSAGRIVSAGALQDYGWVNKPFQEDVSTAFGIETSAVVLLNDCVAAAKAQQVSNARNNGPVSGYVETISTGFGGAGFDGNDLISDEPGHEFFKAGAICGCGNDGCVEAHISGSGILRNRNIRAEDLPLEVWESEIVPAAVSAHVQLLERLANTGFSPQSIYLFGSVALKAPRMFDGIRQGLEVSDLDLVPQVEEATHGKDSGIVGAGAAARELLAI